MQAPRTEATGTSGQSFVKAEFEEFGWGALPNAEHDLGTDLFLMARDAKRFDLGLLIGAQVKNGSSYFTSTQLDEGTEEVTGWWYAESDNRHFDYWANHSIPHLLILRDPQSKVSYWVHVTSDAVESTGKGSKILVPAHQTVSEDMRDALTAVATSPAKSTSLDGSAWNIGKPVPEADHLRYALVAPRLVAPHANLGGVVPSAVEAIAMLMQGRFHDLHDIKSHEARTDGDGVPDVDAWEWGLFDGLWAWVAEGDLSKLVGLPDGGTDRQRAAAAVVRATAYAELARPGDGLAAIAQVEADEGLGVVDTEWLRSHKARCLVQLGRIEEAHACAIEVQRLRSTAPQDPTATALVASSTALIFNLLRFGSGDIGELIQSIDTSTRWWRATTIATGLQKQFEDSYRVWGRDKSVTWFASDTVWTSLRSAALLAGTSADHGGWANATCLLAMRELIKAEPTEERVIAESLRDLLRSGSKKELEFAAKRFGDDGPVGPLVTLNRELDLETTSRSCLGTALAFLRHAGDFSQTLDADRHAKWLIQTLEDPDSLRERLKPMFLVESAVLEALQGLMRSVSSETMRQIIDHLLDLPPVDNQSLANSYRRIVSRVDYEAWTEDDLSRLASRSGDNWELQEDIDGVLAQHDPDFRHSLLEGVRHGHVASLSNFGDVRELPTDVVKSAIEKIAERAESQLSQAANGAYGFGRHEVCRDLVLLNSWHPAVADWATVKKLLAEPKVHPSHVCEAINLLGRLDEQIEEEVKVDLRPVLKELIRRPSLFSKDDLWQEGEDPKVEARLTLARLFPGDVTDIVIRELLRGSKGERRALAKLLGDRRQTEDMNLLFALSKDTDVDVRVDAIISIARLMFEQGADVGSRGVLESLIEGGGPRVARILSSYLLNRQASEMRTSVLHTLKDHPSALVRARVSHALAGA